MKNDPKVDNVFIYPKEIDKIEYGGIQILNKIPLNLLRTHLKSSNR